MKKFSITLFYRGVSIKADCAEAAESLFKELFEIYGTDVFDSCDIVATEIEKEEYKMLNCTLLEYYMDNILKLSDDELQQVITAIEKEQNERKNKRKHELVDKAVAALHDLQAEGFNGCIVRTCEECGGDVRFTLGELAEKIKYM